MAPPTELMDELVGEVLLRLRPDEPEHLFRAALVCKPWLRIICDPAFRRRYLAFHGAPPLLGLLHSLQVLQGIPAHRFSSTTSMPDFPYPCSHGHGIPLDCRHGRVLVHMFHDRSRALLVWDPITGDRHVFPAPDIKWLICTAAVFCAVYGCQHLDCQGGPFRVAFLATDDDALVVKASVYSSVTGAWSAPVSLDDGCECYAQHIRDETAANIRYHASYVMPQRVAVIGEEFYFTIRLAHKIVKYNLPNNCFSMINPPPGTDSEYPIALMVTEDNSLGFACIKNTSLCLWSRKVGSEAAAEWVQCRVIELETIIPVVDPDYKTCVVGSAEGVGVIFISTDAGLFTIQLKSERVRKVDEPGEFFSVLPYMSFYTPDRGRLLSLARAH